MHVNEIEARIEFGDCDPASLIYYPKYFDLFDRATWRMFESVGLTRQVLRAEHGIVGFPLVDVGAKFLAPVRWGDTLAIKSNIGRWGRTSFRVEHRVFKEETLCADGFEARVWVRAKPESGYGFVPTPVAESVRELLGQATEG